MDINLLVLLVIGAVDTRWIGRHKRSRAFQVSDWQWLLDLIGSTPILTSPHILTEASNLLRKSGMAPPADAKLMAALADFVAPAQEEHVPAREVSIDSVFLRLGLTDAVLHSLARPDVHLLTTDFGLYNAALSRNQPVTNFNHYRDATA